MGSHAAIAARRRDHAKQRCYPLGCIASGPLPSTHDFTSPRRCLRCLLHSETSVRQSSTPEDSWISRSSLGAQSKSPDTAVARKPLNLPKAKAIAKRHAFQWSVHTYKRQSSYWTTRGRRTRDKVLLWTGNDRHVQGGPFITQAGIRIWRYVLTERSQDVLRNLPKIANSLIPYYLIHAALALQVSLTRCQAHPLYTNFPPNPSNHSYFGPCLKPAS